MQSQFKMPAPLHSKSAIVHSRNSINTKHANHPSDAMQAAEIARQRIQARSISMATPAYRASNSMYTPRALTPPPRERERERERETYRAPSAAPHLKNTVSQIWNAINLMLPKGSEDDVLRAIMEQCADRLHVNLDMELSGPQCSGSSSSDEIPLPHRLLVGNRGDLNGYYDHDRSPPRNRMSETLGAGGGQPRIRLLDSAPKPRPSVPPNRWRQPFRREPSEDSDYIPGRPRNFTAEKQRKRTAIQRQRGITLATVNHSQFHRMADPLPIRRRNVKQEGDLNSPIQLRDADNRINGYQCPRCPQSKKLRKDVVVHISGHGTVGKFTCNECDFATDSKQVWNWHAKAHLQLPESTTAHPTWNSRPSVQPNRATLRNPSAADDLFSNPGSPAPAVASGLACVISSCNFRGTDCKAIAEHMSREHNIFQDQTIPKKAHAKPPRPVGRARTTLGTEDLRQQQQQEFQCPECPDAFAFKTHLILHRRRRHPQQRRGVRKHNIDTEGTDMLESAHSQPPLGSVVKKRKRRVPKVASRRKRRAAAKKAVQTRSAKTTPKRAVADGEEFVEEGVEDAEDAAPAAPWQRASVIVSMPEYVENQVSTSSSASSVPNGHSVTVHQVPPKNRGGRKRKIPAEVDEEFPPPLDMAALEQNGNGWAGRERSLGAIEVEYESAPGFEVSDLIR